MITRESCAVSKPGNKTEAKVTIISLLFTVIAGVREKKHYMVPLSIVESSEVDLRAVEEAKPFDQLSQACKNP